MSPPNIHLAIKGGLGNQMFQAALGVALRKLTGATVFYHFGHYSLDSYDRKPLLSHFPKLQWIPCPSGVDLRKYLFIKEEDNLSIHQIADLATKNNDIVVEGYWQSEAFFSEFRSDVSAAFELTVDPGIADFAKTATQKSMVALHVRRSDYGHHGVAKVSYYKKAITEIRSKLGMLPALIFTDEANFCRSVFSDMEAMYITGTRNFSVPIDDFYVMSRCKHFIIANSSFSWWAAWLGETSDSLIYAPDPWFVEGPRGPQKNARDIVPDRWITLTDSIQAP